MTVYKLYAIPESHLEKCQSFVDIHVYKDGSLFEAEKSIQNGAFSLARKSSGFQVTGIYWPVPDTEDSPQDLTHEVLINLIEQTISTPNFPNHITSETR